MCRLTRTTTGSTASAPLASPQAATMPQIQRLTVMMFRSPLILPDWVLFRGTCRSAGANRGFPVPKSTFRPLDPTMSDRQCFASRNDRRQNQDPRPGSALDRRGVRAVRTGVAPLSAAPAATPSGRFGPHAGDLRALHQEEGSHGADPQSARLSLRNRLARSERGALRGTAEPRHL